MDGELARHFRRGRISSRPRQASSRLSGRLPPQSAGYVGASSLAELASNSDPAKLEEAVTNYTQCCRRAAPLRHAPFVALGPVQSYIMTMTAARRERNLQVSKGDPDSRLYAAVGRPVRVIVAEGHGHHLSCFTSAGLPPRRADWTERCRSVAGQPSRAPVAPGRQPAGAVPAATTDSGRHRCRSPALPGNRECTCRNRHTIFRRRARSAWSPKSRPADRPSCTPAARAKSSAPNSRRIAEQGTSVVTADRRKEEP